MNFTKFARFIVGYSVNNFSSINEPELVAVYGIIEEWGEFMGEYKRLVRDNFVLEAVENFDAKAPIEWADTVAYWIVRMHHMNFGVINYTKVEEFDLCKYDSLSDAIERTTINMAAMFLWEEDPYAFLNDLMCVGFFLGCPIDDAFEQCAIKLQNRAASGNFMNR